MSEAEELLNSVSSGDATAYTADAGIEEHIIIDKDRVINVPKPLQRIAVQYDHNIETVTFDCPRYWDNNDLSKMYIYINYLRIDKVKGRYLAKNVRVSDTDENIIHFDWTIGNEVTTANGKLTFLVCALQTNSEGIEELHWNTEINTEMTISDGLECDDYIMEEYPDIINDLLFRMDSILVANTPILDKSLTQANLAAEAKATGEAISKVDNRVTEIIEGSDYVEVVGNPINLKEASNNNCNLTLVGVIDQKVMEAEDGISVVGEDSINVTDVDVNKEASIFIGANTSQETREGYNKLSPAPANNSTTNGVTFSSDGAGEYKIVATNPVSAFTHHTFELKEPYIIQNGDFLHCMNVGLSNNVAIVLIENENQIMYTTPGVDNRVEDLSKYVGRTVTKIRLTINQGFTCDITVTPMIINDSNPKPYEQYGVMPSLDYPSEIKSVKGSYKFVINETQTINLDFPEGIELNKLGDITDKLEFSYTMDETGYKTIDRDSVKKIGNSVRERITNVAIPADSVNTSETNKMRFQKLLSNTSGMISDTNINTNVSYMNRYKLVEQGKTFNCVIGYTIGLSGTQPILNIYDEKYNDITNYNDSKSELLSAYNTFLDENETYIVYQISTPITTQITDETFISQLEALINIKPDDETINIVITSENENSCLPLTEFLYNYVTVIPSTIRKSDVSCLEGECILERWNKNYYDVNDIYICDPGLTIKEDGWIDINIDNRSGTSLKYVNLYTNDSKRLKENTRYYIVTEIDKINTNATTCNLNLISNTSTGTQLSQFIDSTYLNLADLDSGVYINTSITREDFNVDNMVSMLRSFIAVPAGSYIKTKIRISVLDHTVTSDDFVYDSFQNEFINLTLPEGMTLYENETIFKEEGKWYKDIKYNKMKIDQNSGVILYSENYQRFRILADGFVAPENGTVAEIYCNRLKTYSKETMHLHDDSISAIDKGGSSFLFRFNSEYITAEKMNEYLAKNPLEIVYKIANPTKVEITDTTLLEQLEQLSKLKTYKGINNFFLTSAGANGLMKLKYKKFNIAGFDDLEEVKEDVEEVKTDVEDIVLNMKKEILEAVFPIGSTYITQTNVNPSTILGIGTWERLKGKVLVGLDENDTNFNTIGKTGGESTHTLTSDEMPKHYHRINMGPTSVTIGEIGVGGPNSLVSRHNYDTNTAYDYTNGEATSVVGGGSAHNNLQPYEVVGYMWIRRA